MTAIVIREYFLYEKGVGDNTLFHYSSLDQILYILVIIAIVTSFVYLIVNEMKFNALPISSKLLEKRVILMIMLHIFAISIITFILLVSKKEYSKAKIL